MSSSISIGLAAARQAAALGYAPPRPAPSIPAASADKPVTPAKPPGTGLLVDTRA